TVFRGKLFVPYCGSLFRGKTSTEFARRMIGWGYPIVWERYLSEPPDEDQAEKVLQSRLTDEMRGWSQALPGCESHLVVCFGYESMIATETFNVDPSVDYKVWMDRQFQRVATDPAFSGIYGLMEYTSGYADEETVRWAALLFRHYGIEGRKDLLSAAYGFRYRPQIIENPDFEDGLRGWEVVMAEEGSVGARKVAGYGWLQGRYPRTEKGDTFLWLKRSVMGPNLVRQKMKHLEPGRLYSLKLVTGDYGALQSGRSVEERHGLQIRIEGGEWVDEKCFDWVIGNNYAHQWGPFDEKNKFWMNYHFRVFRADKREGVLILSDWKGTTEPGARIGQELMINFIEVQPYLE
ncbi:MAG: hypothetical protein NZ959_12440, partial [Armatimonadetes bacterium]|nr:hypothetical protein [Armatimonadota bacterium]